MVPKVVDGEVQCQELLIKGTVLLLGNGQLLGKESQRCRIRTLGEDGSNSDVGGVCCELKIGSRVRMDELNGVAKGGLGSDEGVGLDSRPVQHILGHLDGGSQQVQRSQHRCKVWDKAVEKVDATQKSLELNFAHWAVHLHDALHLGREGNDAGR